MVRPCAFHSNPLTAASNAFQAREPMADQAASNGLAAEQFDGLVARLEAAGVRCIVFDDTPDPPTPDSIFPNNWISTHADGRVVLYPMEAENRRGERRSDIVSALANDGFDVREVLDFSRHEQSARFLEGTGSLVFDRVERVAYACISSRTDAALATEVCAALQYELVAFDAVDRQGQPIYHTNVMMFVGTQTALVCADSIVSSDRARVLERLAASGRDVLEIGYPELEAFAGNMLELVGAEGPVIALSARAERSLDDDVRTRLSDGATLVAAPIDHIENQSGGSVRCMLAEVHLPPRP